MKIAFLHKLENWFRKYIKTLRSGGVNRLWADDIYKKAEGLQRCQAVIEILALGSSHGTFGFKAKANEFNFCASSQDLYYSWKLYEVLANVLPHLNTVILFYSVFSPGFELEQTGEVDRCEYYYSILGIPYKTERIQREKCRRNIHELWRHYVKKNPLVLSPEYRGNEELQKTMKLSLEERVKAHLKHNMRNNGQTQFVERMKLFAEQAGHRLVVVVPPFRMDYVGLMGEFETVFKELKAIGGLDVLSFYHDEAFLPTDFVDMDHLNSNGASKLSKKISLYLTGENNANDKIS